MGVVGSIKSTCFSVVSAVERSVRGKRMSSDPTTARSILVLEYQVPLGCCVHQTPMYEAIKRVRPETVITVATRGLGADLLRHHPFVDHVLVTSNGLKDPIGAARELRAQLAERNLQPDCILTGVADQRTVMAAMAILSAPVWRGGFTQAPQLYQWPLKYDWSLSQIGNVLRLAKLVGCDVGHLEPRIFFSEADRVVARGLLNEANPQGQPLVVMVTQGSGGQNTGWRHERNLEVIHHITATLGYALVYVGTAGDAARIETLRADAGGAGQSLAGKTTPTQLAALLAMSDWIVSIDTGTMHVGRAMQVPMVVLGPSWQKPLEWLPLGMERARVLRGDDPNGKPPGPPGYKLDEIESAQVIDALDELVHLYPASAEARAQRVARSLSTVDHR